MLAGDLRLSPVYPSIGLACILGLFSVGLDTSETSKVILYLCEAIQSSQHPFIFSSSDSSHWPQGQKRPEDTSHGQPRNCSP